MLESAAAAARARRGAAMHRERGREGDQGLEARGDREPKPKFLSKIERLHWPSIYSVWRLYPQAI